MSVQIVQRANTARWHELEDGRVVSIHAVILDKEDEPYQRMLIMVDNKTWPGVFCTEKNIGYTLIRNATVEEEREFFSTNRHVDRARTIVV